MHLIWSMILKLVVGMIGILLFLRLTGKIQMANMSPLDSVNTIVLGAFVGSIIYMPDTSVWVMVLGIVIWTLLNMGVRFLLKKNFFRILIHGREEILIKDGNVDLKILKRNNMGIDQFRAKLREKDIFSLFDVDNVRFETDGKFTVSKKKKAKDSYLLINNGEIIEDNMKEAKCTRSWLKGKLEGMGFKELKEISGVEWTPGVGLYVIGKDGKVSVKKDRSTPYSNKKKIVKVKALQ